MAKKLGTAKLKKKLWSIFGEFIRLRDAPDGYGNCISCEKQIPYPNGRGDWHAGHYFPRSTTFSNLYFDERNVNGQCLTEESNVQMLDGQQKSIKDLKVRDDILGFGEQSYMPMPSLVLEVRSFVPKEMYEVEMENGEKFYATGDHRVVANGKWMKIEDMLHSCSVYDILEL